jgi:hypothetical protein
MSELAKHAKQNGVLTPNSYGADPNNPYTWDAHRVMGCLCDEGYEGFDCSLRACPAGNDPSARMGEPEVRATETATDLLVTACNRANTVDVRVLQIQLLQCKAGDGSVTLAFRDEVTSPISYDATSDDLKAQLEELPTIGGVEVQFEEGFTAFCDPAGGNVVRITFTAVPGDVPAIVVSQNALIDTLGLGTVGSGEVAIATDGDSLGPWSSRRGTTTVDVCNNHGLCDSFRGQCRCFPGWASSDGAGNYGIYGDCGYRVPTPSNLRRRSAFDH